VTLPEMLSHEILQSGTKGSHSYTSEMLKIRVLPSKQILHHSHKNRRHNYCFYIPFFSVLENIWKDNSLCIE